MQGIDTHAHVFSATAPAVAGSRYRPPYEASLADWRSRWAGAGITHGVVVQPSFFGTDNAETLAAVASDPRHAARGGGRRPGFDDAALARLHAGGVRAIRLNLKSVADYAAFASPAWASLFARAHALGWHVGDLRRGRALAGDRARLRGSRRSPSCSTTSAIRAPRPPPWTRPSPRSPALARSRAVWAKLSAPLSPRRRGRGGARRALDRQPSARDRLVWGSDWPWTNHERENDYRRLRDALDAWVGAARARAILWDNAARLYDFS